MKNQNLLVLVIVAVILLVLVACQGFLSTRTRDNTGSDPTLEVIVEKKVLTQKRVQVVIATTTTAEVSPTPTNSKFTNTSPLCNNLQGPDCTNLRLGDDYLTTSAPTIGISSRNYGCRRDHLILP